MNPNAILMWTIFAIIGYLANDFRGALIGLLVGLIISFLASFAPTGKRRGW